MEDWTFKQVLGVVLICVGGLLSILMLGILLCMLFRPEIVGFIFSVLIGFIFSVLTLLLGIWLWRSGVKENDKKE